MDGLLIIFLYRAAVLNNVFTRNPTSNSQTDYYRMKTKDRIRSDALVEAHFSRAWGSPFAKSLFLKNDFRIHLLGFFDSKSKIMRCASVGICQDVYGTQDVGYELVFACYSKTPNIDFDIHADGLMSLACHLRKLGGVRGAMSMDLQIGPWHMIGFDSLLIIEPLGEAEQTCSFRAPELAFELCWCVPVFSSEREFAATHGISKFFDLLEQQGKSELDLSRSVAQVPGL